MNNNSAWLTASLNSMIVSCDAFSTSSTIGLFTGEVLSLSNPLQNRELIYTNASLNAIPSSSCTISMAFLPFESLPKSVTNHTLLYFLSEVDAVRSSRTLNAFLSFASG